MAETPKEKPLETKPLPFNEEKVREHFGKIEDAVNKQQGKKGFNPFLWLKEVVNPLIVRFQKGERTSELEGAILSLPIEPPKPNDGKGLGVDDAPTTMDVTQAPVAPGLKLNTRLFS